LKDRVSLNNNISYSTWQNPDQNVVFWFQFGVMIGLPVQALSQGQKLLIVNRRVSNPKVFSLKWNPTVSEK
jgi:hypothetical protein